MEKRITSFDGAYELSVGNHSEDGKWNRLTISIHKKGNELSWNGFAIINPYIIGSIYCSLLARQEDESIHYGGYQEGDIDCWVENSKEAEYLCLKEGIKRFHKKLKESVIYEDCWISFHHCLIVKENEVVNGSKADQQHIAFTIKDTRCEEDWSNAFTIYVTKKDFFRFIVELRRLIEGGLYD
jgi:hypothetical protein